MGAVAVVLILERWGSVDVPVDGDVDGDADGDADGDVGAGNA